MKRLTERDEYGNANIIGVDSADLQLNLTFEEFSRVTDALNRLAAYEDGELMPDELDSEYINESMVMLGQYLQIGTLEECRVAITKLAEYEDAEEQGLLLRLPCRPNEEVWIGCNKYNPHKGMYPSLSAIVSDMEDGFAIGYTRDAVEKALEEMRENEK